MPNQDDSHNYDVPDEENSRIVAVELRRAIMALLGASGPIEGAKAVQMCHDAIAHSAYLEK